MSEYTGVDTEVGEDNSEKEDVHTGKEIVTDPKTVEDKDNEKSDFEVSNDEKTHDQEDADERTQDEDHPPASSSSSAPASSSAVNMNASFGISKDDENKKLRDAVVELQKQLKEAKQIKDAGKKDKKDLLQKIQKERDDANFKAKQLEKELQSVKIELEHLQAANTNQSNKFFEDQLKYQKEKADLEQKVKNLNKELDDVQQRNFELEDEKDTLVTEKEDLIEKLKNVEVNAEVSGGEAKKIKVWYFISFFGLCVSALLLLFLTFCVSCCCCSIFNVAALLPEHTSFFLGLSTDNLCYFSLLLVSSQK